jgi:hypothetical protein
MLHNRARRLPMHQVVAVCQHILKHRHDRVAVVRRLRVDVFEYKRQRLQTPAHWRGPER